MDPFRFQNGRTDSFSSYYSRFGIAGRRIGEVSCGLVTLLVLSMAFFQARIVVGATTTQPGSAAILPAPPADDASRTKQDGSGSADAAKPDSNVGDSILKNILAFCAVGLLMGAGLALLCLANSDDRTAAVGVALATAPLFPATAALFTVIIYLLMPFWFWTAPIAGLTMAVILWCVASLSLGDMARPQYAIPSSYRELRQRLGLIEAQLSGLLPLPQRPSSPAEVATVEAKSQFDAITKDLEQPGVAWIEGNGYIGAWQRLHRAEEALIEIEPTETVIAGAVYDELRLIDSTIGQREDLLAKIRHAAEVLDPNAARYLQVCNSKPAAPALTITTSSPLPDAVIGTSYNCTLAAEGGKPPFNWTSSSTGPLPDWLNLTAAGTLVGTAPSVASGNSGPCTFAIRVTDSANMTALKTLTLNTLSFGIVTTSPLPDAIVGVAYMQTLIASGGSGGYIWAAASQAPAKLALTPAGVLSGTPVTAGTSIFNVTVTDAASPPLSITKALFLTVKAPPSAVGLTTLNSSDSDVLARSILKTVRRSINEFRDDRWNALVVARNRLTRTTIITGLISYALFAIAIFVGVPRASIIAVATFCLVGALVGLINRGNEEAAVDTAVEDYGLSNARLISMPLISGLAGIAGVVLIALLPAAAVLAPASAPQTTPSELFRGLGEIFDLTHNRAGIVVAAVFGLTPALLFSRLRQQAEGYKNEIKKSEAGNGGTKPAEPANK